MKCSENVRLDGVRASTSCDEPSQCTQEALDRQVRDKFQVYGSENHTLAFNPFLFFSLLPDFGWTSKPDRTLLPLQ
ncbi:hypothetical protein T4B_4833 [Trichinella pseudospiralis]|uniref:Uncharacterized protein n=1 Tax=Trichinella pseudospiralis TaxID=6337 RepID=A0A0V1K5V0_TRIPS|nr:hypothetical protein T4A_10709 [Trichinella pseudospiralis]KRZ33886.1 hypothetical protein T4B_4833 [Trichinella pseudospiralis]KRZ42589.1 hypothetical protein T4C_10787 [Trichinella pseudospiralis]